MSHELNLETFANFEAPKDKGSEQSPKFDIKDLGKAALIDGQIILPGEDDVHVIEANGMIYASFTQPPSEIGQK